jgi:hypothetical protein
LVVIAVTLPLVLIKDDDSSSSDQQFPGDNRPVNFVPPTAITEGPFSATVELLTEDVLRGYETEEELEEALANAARFLLNIVVQRNANGYDDGVTYYDGPDFEVLEGDVERSPEEAPSAEAVMGDATTGEVGDDVNDYGTNNQEDGVEEGDLIVSDGMNGTSW